MLSSIVILIPALLATLLLGRELYLKRKLMEQELEFRKKEFEEAQIEREERLEWLKRETLKLVNVGELLGEHITGSMKRDIGWAVEALNKAKLGPYADSLFGQRSGHFRDEKEYIAEEFLPYLLERCKFFIENGRNVCLLVDSGTTLFPFFKKLGLETVRCRLNSERWLDKFAVVTNNLPGVESLIEFGRVNPNDPYSELAFECRLLPGVPLPVYSAVVGEETVQALERLRTTRVQKTVFIGLVTGNWIRLRRSPPACPVPLVRGHSHLHFKQALITCADEVYVVAPLGKIFANAAPEEVNQALGFDDKHINASKKSYHEVDISGPKAASVKLISTCRMGDRVLSNLSILVGDRLDVHGARPRHFPESAKAQVPHILFPFDRLPNNWFLEKEVEFPHPYTRNEDFMKTYFFVPDRPPEKSRDRAA
jgi:hypothetical protein